MQARHGRARRLVLGRRFPVAQEGDTAFCRAAVMRAPRCSLASRLVGLP